MPGYFCTNQAIMLQLTYCHSVKRVKLTTLQNRRLQDILIVMFKVKNKLVMNYTAKGKSDRWTNKVYYRHERQH